VTGAPAPDPTVLAVWRKVHDTYLETQLHRVRLLVGRRLGETDLDEDVDGHDERLRELEAELVGLGAPSGIAALRQAAGLTPLEVEVVVSALAYELDPSAGRLFGALLGEDGARPPSSAVAAALFGLTLTEAAELQSPAGPLHRFRLLVPADPRLPAVEQPLRLQRRVLGYLRGRNVVDDGLLGVVETMWSAPLVAAHREIADRLTRWLADGVVTRSRIGLVGPPAQGRDAVAAAVAHGLGMHPLRLDLERLVARPDRLELARLVGREALLLPAVVYVDVPHAPAEDPTRAVAIAETIDTLEGLVLLGSDQRAAGSADALVVQVPALEQAGRAALWAAATADQPGVAATGADLEPLAEQFAFGPSDVARVVAEASDRAAVQGSGPVTPDDLWSVARGLIGTDLGSLAQRIEPSASWDRLVLPGSELRLLRHLVAQARHRTTVYERWGLGTGISALFAGPSGTGKTMAAEVLAGELDLDLYRIDLSSGVSKYIGETEKNLRRVFDAAEDGRRHPAVRRGRRAVRQAQRGQGQPRPLRQHRGELPAPAHGGLRAASRS
jgi:hypothetical protein